MNRRLAFCFFAVLIFASLFTSFGAEPGLPQSALEANKELEGDYYKSYIDKSGEKLILNPKLAKGDWSQFLKSSDSMSYELKGVNSVFAYGKAYGEKSFGGKGTFQRYIGRTLSGDDFQNPFFPIEKWSSSNTLEDLNWIEGIWSREEYKDTRFDYPTVGEKYLPNIISGLEFDQINYSNDLQLIDLKDKRYKAINWSKFVHIIQPPTRLSWGMGIMKNAYGGSEWYYVVPLPSTGAIDKIGANVKVEIRYFDEYGGRIGKTTSIIKKANLDGSQTKVDIPVKKIEGYSFYGYRQSYESMGKAGSLIKGDGVAVNIDKKHGKIFINEYFKATKAYKIGDIYPRSYRSSEKVLTMVPVKNTSNVGRMKVKVSFACLGKKQSQYIDIPPRGTRVAVFKWTTASYSCSPSVQVDLEDGSFEGSKKVSVKIADKRAMSYPKVNKVPVNPPPPLDNCLSRRWTESRFAGYSSVKGADGIVYKVPSYSSHSFYAELEVRSYMDPSKKIKSGYGFSNSVQTVVRTNYDDPGRIIGLQSVMGVVPEFKYDARYPVAFESKGSLSNMSNGWTLSKNPTTKIKLRKWYVPIWFPSKVDYVLQLRGQGAYTPGGELKFSKNCSLPVNGSMYEDDVTS